MKKGDIIVHKQMGQMVIENVNDSSVEVYKISEEGKRFKNTYVMHIEDFIIESDKPKEHPYKPKKKETQVEDEIDSNNECFSHDS